MVNKSSLDFDKFRLLLKQNRECDIEFIAHLFAKRSDFVPTDDDLIDVLNSKHFGGINFINENYKSALIENKQDWFAYKWEKMGGRPFYLCSNYWFVMACLLVISSIQMDILAKTQLIYAVSIAYMVGRAIYKYGRGKKESGFATSEFYLSVFLVLWTIFNIGGLWEAVFVSISGGVYTLVRDITKHRSKQNTLMVR